MLEREEREGGSDEWCDRTAEERQNEGQTGQKGGTRDERDERDERRDRTDKRGKSVR